MNANWKSISAVPAVVIDNLTHRFRMGWTRRRVVAVEHLSFSIMAGTIHGLIGPNGSGKSTTIKCILGLITADEGVIRVFGKELPSRSVRAEMGYMPENPYFPRFLTGRELLCFHGELCGLSKKVCRQRADALLADTGMSEAGTRRLATYSKGMLQRIGLAQALIHRPRLIILDEPTAGLDPQGSRDIRRMILKLKEEGHTILLTSHLLDQMEEVCDAITLLHRGKAIFSGALEDLLHQPCGIDVHLPEAKAIHVARYEKILKEVLPETMYVRPARQSLEKRFLEMTQSS